MHGDATILSPAASWREFRVQALAYSRCGDQGEVELLVEASFTPLEAIKIATFNGAWFLGEDAHIGSLAVGKQADLMIVRGNPAVNISEIEKVEIVFKDGVGYDSQKRSSRCRDWWGIR